MRVLILLILFLGGCAKAAPGEPPQSFCREQAFEGDRFIVCDNKGGELRLFAAGKNETPLRSFSDVMRKVETDKVAFAMNAGMFDENGRPIGLAITAPGVQVRGINLRDGPGNFHLKPNGVFQVPLGGRAYVSQSAPMPVQVVPTIQLATQSGPMLVIGGKLHPKLEHDGTSRLTRNGVGVRDGKPVFVISETAVSLGKFARFFRDSLKTPNALYFDGSVSSLWDPANGRQDAHSKLGPIIVAFKPAASKPGREGRARP
jgi:uncharacterized protein YigE (DUF2233 family)